MVNFGFFITARNNSSKERILRININEWHELLFALCPNFAAGTSGFKFERQEVLSQEEIEMLEKVTYDEQAVSISEEYEEYKEPNFETAYKWLSIFKKIEKKYFETEQDDFINGIVNSGNDESVIKKTIQKIRSSQFHFDQIKQSLSIAHENNLEVAFTISDY